MFKRYKITWFGLALAVLVGILSNIFDLDPFDNLVLLFQSVEDYEIDEIFIALIIFLLFLATDLILHQKDRKVEAEKVKVYKAMASSTHHILNNFLHQMQLFKMTADNTPGFDPRILQLYNTIINEATQQIEALSSISEINETAIQKSVMPRGSQDSQSS